jgi:serine protease AprX
LILSTGMRMFFQTTNMGEQLRRVVVLAVLTFLTHGYTLHGAEKIGLRLQSLLSTPGHNNSVMIWVMFTDKGSHEALAKSVPRDVVSPRSLARRMKVRSADAAVDYTDLPIEEAYAAALGSYGFTIRQRSKWLNGVSGVTDITRIPQLASLPFVRSIELVARFARNPDVKPDINDLGTPQPMQKGTGTHTMNYGNSYAQLALMNVPALHDLNYTGKGVIIGVFDNGFRLLTHEAFDSMKIVGTYDFVDHKVSVVPNNPNSAFGSHGLETLSEIAGRKDGQLIGAAFEASMILARTENDSSETPIEEDNWVAAIEWADSLGVDVTSTSLGYLTYDSPYSSYSWTDMDGNTMMITKAADMAASKGILVCNSAGNNGYNASHNTLNGPADGFQVLAIGAVNPDGSRSSFSSVGPTTSLPARIKPDLMAQGTSVRVASPVDPLGYYDGFSGTSAACPLAAGAIALLVQAKPQATPAEITDAVRASASNAGSPDNLNGWGIIDALGAASRLSVIGVPRNSQPATFMLLQNYPNPFNPLTHIRFDLPAVEHVRIVIHDILGREVATVLDETETPGQYAIPWIPDRQMSRGVYFYTVTAGKYSGSGKMIYQK